MTDKSYVTGDTYCLDPEVHDPPKGKDVWVVSKYGVGRKGPFIEGYDIAWYPLPRLSPAAKRKLINPERS